eukprot:SAG11_NODE_518_length_8798_cov_5.156110_6_plen_190_part_00
MPRHNKLPKCWGRRLSACRLCMLVLLCFIAYIMLLLLAAFEGSKLLNGEPKARKEPGPGEWAEQLAWQQLLPVFADMAALKTSPGWQSYLDKVYGVESLQFPLDLRATLAMIYWDVAPAGVKKALTEGYSQQYRPHQWHREPATRVHVAPCTALQRGISTTLCGSTSYGVVSASAPSPCLFPPFHKSGN